MYAIVFKRYMKTSCVLIINLCQIYKICVMVYIYILCYTHAPVYCTYNYVVGYYCVML